MKYYSSESEEGEMNWLMYICGGFLFFLIIFSLIKSFIAPKLQEKGWFLISEVISTVCVWIWICWRFIR